MYATMSEPFDWAAVQTEANYCKYRSAGWLLQLQHGGVPNHVQWTAIIYHEMLSLCRIQTTDTMTSRQHGWMDRRTGVCPNIINEMLWLSSLVCPALEAGGPSYLGNGTYVAFLPSSLPIQGF